MEQSSIIQLVISGGGWLLAIGTLLFNYFTTRKARNRNDAAEEGDTLSKLRIYVEKISSDLLTSDQKKLQAEIRAERAEFDIEVRKRMATEGAKERDALTVRVNDLEKESIDRKKRELEREQFHAKQIQDLEARHAKQIEDLEARYATIIKELREEIRLLQNIQNPCNSIDNDVELQSVTT